MTTSIAAEPRSTNFLQSAARRWPTVVGIAFGLDGLFSAVADDTVLALADPLPMLALVYVVVSALLLRRWTWPIAVGCIGLFVALRFQDWVEPTVVILAVALAASVWGAGHGRHRDSDFRLQLIGMAGFTAVAITGLLINPDVGRYLVAAGWLAHGIWDYVHLARNRVVSRTFAETCAAIDVMVAASLIIAPIV